jgi:hypothetical protein
MYSATRLVAAMNLRHGDPVVRVQRLALAVAMMLSSSNVSPVTTILASLLFAVLAGWARAHVWTRARKTFSWPDGRTSVLVSSAQIVCRSPVFGGAHREPRQSSESMSADVHRLWAMLACASRTLGHLAPAQRVT